MKRFFICADLDLNLNHQIKLVSLESGTKTYLPGDVYANPQIISKVIKRKDAVEMNFIGHWYDKPKIVDPKWICDREWFLIGASQTYRRVKIITKDDHKWDLACTFSI